MVIKEMNKGRYSLSHLGNSDVCLMQPFPWKSAVRSRNYSAVNICVTLVHLARYDKIRPDIAYIRPDIIHIRLDICCHLWNII